MPFLDGSEMIEYAQDAELEEKLYMRWVIGYQMCMGFEEFKRNIGNTHETKDNRSASEILEKVRDITG